MNNDYESSGIFSIVLLSHCVHNKYSDFFQEPLSDFNRSIELRFVISWLICSALACPFGERL